MFLSLNQVIILVFQSEIYFFLYCFRYVDFHNVTIFLFSSCNNFYHAHANKFKLTCLLNKNLKHCSQISRKIASKIIRKIPIKRQEEKSSTWIKISKEIMSSSFVNVLVHFVCTLFFIQFLVGIKSYF